MPDSPQLLRPLPQPFPDISRWHPVQSLAILETFGSADFPIALHFFSPPLRHPSCLLVQIWFRVKDFCSLKFSCRDRNPQWGVRGEDSSFLLGVTLGKTDGQSSRARMASSNFQCRSSGQIYVCLHACLLLRPQLPSRVGAGPLSPLSL